MHKSYRFAIAYFAIFGALLLISGAVLFASKLGFGYESVSIFYLGTQTGFSQPKSSYGLLETALPHLGAMGLFIFVLGHFLLFTDKRQKNRAIKPLLFLFIAALLDIASGFLIIQGWMFFIWIKIAAFLLLQILGLYLLYIVFDNTLKSIAKYAGRQ